MTINEPANSLEGLLSQFFNPIVNPTGNPAPAGTSTTTNTTTPLRDHPHDVAVRILEDAEKAANEIALPEVRADQLLRIAQTYMEL